MQVLAKYIIDIAKKGARPVIDAVQYDAQSRVLDIQLTESGEPWTPPAGAWGIVSVLKPDGTTAVYDVDEAGNTAVTFTDHGAMVILAAQALACAGEGLVGITFYSANGARLAMFNMRLRVQMAVVADDTITSSDYYNILSEQIALVLATAAGAGGAVWIRGTYPTLAALETAVPEPAQGAMYNVGTEAPYEIYMWDDGADAWIDQGHIEGPQGEQGVQGPQGIPGPQGERGATGVGLDIKGLYASSSALEEAVPSPSAGDAYMVGAAAPYDLYIYSGSVWVNNGAVPGLPIDATLTAEGQAADAKATGDEIANLEERCDEQNSIVSLAGSVPIPFQLTNTGYYIRVSTGELTSSTRYCATDYVDLTAYKRINYKRIATTSSAPTVGIAFYDANKTYVSGIRAKGYASDYEYYGMELVDKPANAVYARFTAFADTAEYGVFELYGASILYEAVNEIKNDASILSSILSYDDNILLPFEKENTGYGIRFSTGELIETSLQCTSNYINISKYANLAYKRIKATASAPTYGMAFYDANKVYISGERCRPNADSFGYQDDLQTISVPSNAVYARFSIITDTTTYGDFSLYGESKLHNVCLYYDSNYRKNVLFANYSSDWYKGQGESYDGFTINTLYSAMITAWDSLLLNSKGYITKETIGTSSDNQTMYCYKLIPTRYRAGTGAGIVNNAPIFLIIPSIHGYEKSASFGAYYFARDLVYNYDKNPVLNSIRTKCILYIIPVGNPYGFDNKTRKNANGVDLNRNWWDQEGDWDASDDPTSAYYMGAEPYDQPETQAIKSVIDNTDNLFYVVDYHTNGQYKADSWAAVNWMTFGMKMFTDNYTKLAYIASQFQVAEISENLMIEYNLDTDGQTIGSITISATTPRPTVGYYAMTQNILAATFEGNNGLPNEESAYSSTEQKINSELIGNWIKNLLLVYSDVPETTVE